MDIEHPMIRQIESTGYPSREYLEYERDLERGDVDEEDEQDQ